jgi:hypothetical protein
VALVVPMAGPASAHTVGGGGPTNFTTHLGALTPATPGLSLKVIENGARLHLTNHTGRPVIVLGYESEPYLRVDADGKVYENLLSQATYLNLTRNANGAAVPSFVPTTATDETRWKRVSGNGQVRWHDHRIHFPSAIKPPLVAQDPGHRHVISDYTIETTVGGAKVVAHGQLVWQPGPSSVPWWVVIGVVFVGCSLLPRLRRWRAAVALAAVGLVGADVVHTLGIALVKEGSASQRWTAFAVGSWVDVVGWVVGLVAAALLLRKRIVSGFFLVGGAGALLAVIGGFGDLSTLNRSTAPFSWSVGLARAVTALTIGAGLGLVATAALGLRRYDRPTSASGGQPSAASAAAIQASSMEDRSESS